MQGGRERGEEEGRRREREEWQVKGTRQFTVNTTTGTVCKLPRSMKVIRHAGVDADAVCLTKPVMGKTLH